VAWQLQDIRFLIGRLSCYPATNRLTSQLVGIFVESESCDDTHHSVPQRPKPYMALAFHLTDNWFEQILKVCEKSYAPSISVWSSGQSAPAPTFSVVTTCVLLRSPSAHSPHSPQPTAQSIQAERNCLLLLLKNQHQLIWQRFRNIVKIVRQPASFLVSAVIAEITGKMRFYI